MDLIRFLKAIVPDEAEGADSPCIFQILPSFSSLLSPRLAEAEDVSLGAGHSGRTQELPTTNTDSGVHPSLSQSNSEKKQKKSSTSSSQHLQIHRNQVGNALSFDYLKVVRFFHFISVVNMTDGKFA